MPESSNFSCQTSHWAACVVFVMMVSGPQELVLAVSHSGLRPKPVVFRTVMSPPPRTSIQALRERMFEFSMVTGSSVTMVTAGTSGSKLCQLPE